MLRTPDAGGAVVSWLLRITLVLTVGGVLLYDSLGIATTHLRLATDASDVAVSARDALDAPGGTVAKALNAARRTAASDGYVLGRDDVSVRDGTVVVRLHHTVDTIVVSRIALIRPWASVEAVGRAHTLKDTRRR